MPDHVNLPARVSVGEYIVDRTDERLIGPSGPVKLGNKAFRVFLALLDQPGQLLTKDVLFTSVWDGMIVSESALTSTIKELRRALGDGPKNPSYIESVYGRGYRLIAEVAEAPASLKVSPEFRSQMTLERSRPPIIVVSGFNDDAVKDAVPYAAPALREEVLSGLSRFREIQLISDTNYDEHRPGSASEDRAYQLTATLLPDGNSAKIIARLRRLGDGRILWVESMSIAKDGLYEGIDRIVRKIVGAVLPVVDQDVFQTLNVSESLFDRYVQARHDTFNIGSFAGAKKAAAAFEAMIRENPDFTLPYFPLALLYNTDYFFTGLGASNAESRAKALKLAIKLISLDPGDAYAYLSLAFCHLYNGNWAAALSNAEIGLEQNPFNPDRLNGIATVMTYLGDFDRADELMKRGRELQPHPNEFYREDAGRLHMLRGQFEEAANQFVDIHNRQIWTHLYQSLTNLQLGAADAHEDFAAWRNRIVMGWHDGSRPDDARILKFIHYHHPFKGNAGDMIFSLAERAFADIAA